MFVKVALNYQWYGLRTDIAFVGPFEEESSAVILKDALHRLISEHSLSGYAELTSFCDKKTGLWLDVTCSADDVYNAMSEALQRYANRC